MGKSYRDSSKRAQKIQTKRERSLAATPAPPEDGEPIDFPALDATPSHWSRKSSRAASRTASRVASRTVSRTGSPLPAPRLGDADEPSFASPLRFAIASNRSSRNASNVQSLAGSDAENDPLDALDALDGHDLLRRMSQILSSRTSARGAHHKMNKLTARSGKKLRPGMWNSAPASNRKEDVISRLCDFLRDDCFNTDVDEEMVHDMHQSLVVSIKQPGSPSEREAALQAIAMVAVASGADEKFLSCAALLGEIISAGASDIVRSHAIRALVAISCFGNSGQEDRERLLSFLLEVVQSDGDSVGAHDSPLVVTAAMEAWAFLATCCELHHHGPDALDAFVEQLSSADSDVQVQAASNIALLFDISRNLRRRAESDFCPPDQELDAADMLDLHEDPKRLARMIHQAAREHHPSDARQKQKRAWRRQQLQYAAVSLDLDVGYGYSTLTDAGPCGSQWYQGYSETVNVKGKKLLIRTWVAWTRTRFLQSLLGGGFPNHLEANERVQHWLADAPILAASQTWDREPLKSEAATLVMNYWENECSVGDETDGFRC